MSKSFQERLLLDGKPYFQDSKFFIKGLIYNTVIVKKSGKYPNEMAIYPDKFEEELAGEFISARRYGYGDGGNIEHTFKNNDKIKTIYLDYYGGTRFRHISQRPKIVRLAIEVLILVKKNVNINILLVKVFGDYSLNNTIQEFIDI